MDRAALVGGDGESHLLDHSPQDLLLDGNGVLVLHLGKVGIVRGGKAQDIKIRVAAGEMDHHPLIGGESHDIVGHAADDVAEQPGVEHNIAALGDIGGDPGADAGLHVVAGDGQLLVGVEQQALQRGNGAFLGYGAAGDGMAFCSKTFSQLNLIMVTLPLYMGCVPPKKRSF